MNDVGVIDRFTNVFSQYIDSGFGLLGGEIAFLTATLVAIDITLAGLFWAMGGGDDIIAKLIKKTLYVGAFAFIINNFNLLAGILFRSFAGLGLTASGSGLTEAQLLQPGRLASVGVDAGRPIMQVVGDLAGFPEALANLDTITVLVLAWLVVIVSFFVLAVQLFVTLIEFKLTTLAGFVLVPFALWNKTAFLAERVLGNVVSSGIKVLVLAVIVGIGSGIFAEFTEPTAGDMTIDNALAVMLASLAMLGLGIFGPGIASGLVAGAPQLGAGAAAGTLLGAGGLAVAGGAAAAGAGRLAAAAGRGGMGAATTLASGARSAAASGASAMGGAAQAGRRAASSVVSTIASGARAVASGARSVAGTYQSGAKDSGLTGAAGVAAGVQRLANAGASGLKNAARAGASTIAQRMRRGPTASASGSRSQASSSPVSKATPIAPSPPAPASTQTEPQPVPDWATRLRQQAVTRGISTAAQTVRSADHPSSGANPSLKQED
jgi:type IV secretion system protein TrbL